MSAEFKAMPEAQRIAVHKIESYARDVQRGHVDFKHFVIAVNRFIADAQEATPAEKTNNPA